MTAEIVTKLLQKTLPMLLGHLDRGHACGVVVNDAVIKGQGVSQCGQDSQTGPTGAGLLIGHPDRTVKGRPRVPIAGIKKVEDFAGKIQPSLLIEVLGIVPTDDRLKLPLERRNKLVNGFSSWREKVW